MKRTSIILIGILSVMLVITAVTGLFLPFIYEGLVPAHLIPESQGQDAVTLFLAVPLLLVAMRWLWQGQLQGTIVAAGTLAYTSYVYIIYAYGGVANGLYFTYVASLGLSAYGLIVVLVQAPTTQLPADAADRIPRQAIAIFNWAISALLVVVWGGLATTAIVARVPSEANLILVTDLAFVIPALVLAGVWLWQRRAWGVLLSASLLVMLVVLMLSIAAGQIMKFAQGFEPAWGLVVLFGGIAVGALILTGLTFRSL